MYELSLLSIIALCMVSFIGVPHGSFDGAVAALLGFQTKKQFIFFVFWYTGNFFGGYNFLDLFSHNRITSFSPYEHNSFWTL
jgi:hypothetical protein